MNNFINNKRDIKDYAYNVMSLWITERRWWFKSSSRIKWTLHVEIVKTIQPIEIYNHLNSNEKIITLTNRIFYRCYSKMVSRSTEECPWISNSSPVSYRGGVFTLADLYGTIDILIEWQWHQCSQINWRYNNCY